MAARRLRRDAAPLWRDWDADIEMDAARLRRGVLGGGTEPMGTAGWGGWDGVCGEEKGDEGERGGEGEKEEERDGERV